jgi:hypothetical protein
MKMLVVIVMFGVKKHFLEAEKFGGLYLPTHVSAKTLRRREHHEKTNGNVFLNSDSNLGDRFRPRHNEERHHEK